jgi:hypothetical protein
MLESLRKTIGSRLPAGFTESSDARLQRTLNHYIKEVIRVQGFINEQDILRETFDSMAGWFRRNTEQITASGPAFKPNPVAAPLPEPIPLRSFGEEEDPIAVFAKIRAARAAAAPAVASPIALSDLMPLSKADAATGSGTAIQPKDFLQRQEDVMKYRETEYNLVLNSKDRNWLNGKAENRYNFSVQLNGGSGPQGNALQTTILNRFRNITRIEFIKAIIPIEGLEVVVPRGGGGAAPADAFLSPLALPFIQIMMSEYQGNNYGTNETVDRSLAICQYDSQWRTEHNGGSLINRGYTLFFPKFMKAQRLYAPTPLANLQSMSFQLLNPENRLLSPASDSFMINRIMYSSDLSGSSYSDPTGDAAGAEYLFIQTSEWFPLWAFSTLDRIQFDGLRFSSPMPAIERAGVSLNKWLERDGGHVVVGIAYTDPSGSVIDGANDCGYANYLIIRHRFQDPVTGDCARALFTNGPMEEKLLATQLAKYPSNGGILNLSRQVQLFLRIITRDFDAASNTRPDNV